MEAKRVKVADVHPYENNPRLNDDAVEAVVASIKECGYCQPIVVDENMVVLSGHTRLKAVARMGWNEVDVIVKDGLTKQQKKKYRVLDNKTGEFSKWDYELLEEETRGMDFSFDFGINTMLTNRVKAEAKEAQSMNKSSLDDGLCTCPRCGAKFAEKNDFLMEDDEE